MLFPVKADKFSGILRRFAIRKYPKIELKPSSTAGNYLPENVIGINNNGGHWVSASNEGLDAYFAVKIVSGVFRITNYSIKSHATCNMQAWVFEASNDNNTYYTLDNKTNNNELFNGKVGQYPVNSQNNYYQYFKIKQTIRNACDSAMRLYRLDFYGEFLPFALNTCKCSRDRNIFMLSLIEIIIFSYV